MALPVSHISSVEEAALDYIDDRKTGSASILKTGKAKLDHVLLGGIE